MVTMSLTELDNDTVRSMAIGAVFSDFGGKINWVDFHRKEDLLVTASDDDSVRLYDIANAKLLKITYHKKHGADRICFTHHPSSVICSSKYNLDSNGESLRYLSMYDNQCLRYFKGHKERFESHDLLVAALKEHFSSYGDLSTVELEEMEAYDSGDGSETVKNCAARIIFTTQRSAKKAFVNGKCWHGHNLQFMWLTPSNSINDHGGRENSPSAPKGTVDAVVQPSENLACVVSEEAAASENGEAESSERNSGVEHMELQEVSQPSPTPMSGEKSPKGNVC